MIRACFSGPTFHHNNGCSSSNIDYYLISSMQDTKLQAVSVQCNKDYPANLSSHDPVLCTLITPRTRQPCTVERFSHSYTDFRQAKLRWEEDRIPKYQALAGKLLSECESYFPSPEFIPLKCQLYSDLLVKAAEVSVDISTTSPAKRAKYPPILHQAWQHLSKMYKIWKISGKPRSQYNSLFVKFRQARANFQCIRRQADNLKNIKRNNILMHTMKTDRNKHLRIVKNMRGYKSKPSLTVLHTPVGDFYGKDVLEGFACDTELLGKAVGENNEYDNKFYKLCVQDNKFIFDLKSENKLKIPEMSLADLDRIIDKEMKVGKACDIYRLTAEHLKNAGHEARAVLLNLINEIIRNMQYLACPQVKMGLGTAAYKGKKKPISRSFSLCKLPCQVPS